MTPCPAMTASRQSDASLKTWPWVISAPASPGGIQPDIPFEHGPVVDHYRHRKNIGGRLQLRGELRRADGIDLLRQDQFRIDIRPVALADANAEIDIG